MDAPYRRLGYTWLSQGRCWHQEHGCSAYPSQSTSISGPPKDVQTQTLGPSTGAEFSVVTVFEPEASLTAEDVIGFSADFSAEEEDDERDFSWSPLEELDERSLFDPDDLSLSLLEEADDGEDEDPSFDRPGDVSPSLSFSFG